MIDVPARADFRAAGVTAVATRRAGPTITRDQSAPGSGLGPGQVGGSPVVTGAQPSGNPRADDRRQVVVQGGRLDEPELVEFVFLQLDGRVIGEYSAVEDEVHD